MNIKFSGSTALIMGGTCTAAITLAEYMIKAEIFPVLTFRSQKGLNIINNQLNKFKGQYKTCHLNFNDFSSIDSAFKEIGNKLDYLIDFAHSNFESLIASASFDDISSYFTSNIIFRAEIIKRTARLMLQKKRGRLIFISSTVAHKPNKGQGYYAAAKLACEALYRNIGIEMGERGITTTIIRPGYLDAGRSLNFFKKNKDNILNKIPIKRLITIQELAETILFYISDSAKSFNADIITMDGGLTVLK